MKTKFMLPLLAVAILLSACNREEPLPGNDDPMEAAFDANGTVPLYTKTEFAAMLANTTDEEAFFKKQQLLTFAITEFLGRNTIVNNNQALGATFPCDVGMTGPGGIFRFLSDKSGLTERGVELKLSEYIETRIVDCGSEPQSVREALCGNLLGSLVHEGRTYTLGARKPQNLTPNNQHELFIGMLGREQAGQVFAVGFRHQLQSHVTSYTTSRPWTQAAGNNMILLEVREVDPVSGGLVERFNDPCYYAGNPGSGGGSGGNGGGLTDDGFEKGPTGPLFGSQGGDLCQGETGLRITEFHLADRNEGNFFGGNSEVVMAVTLYNSNAPDSLYRTNENGQIKTISYGGNSITYRKGQLLGEVPPSMVSAGSQTIFIPAGNDGVIIEDGFCDDFGSIGYGYDRLVITIFEFDPILGITVFEPITNLEDIYLGDNHWCKLNDQLDTWFTNFNTAPIELDDFLTNNNELYLFEVPGGFAVQATQPPSTRSWFKIELF